MLGYKAQRCQHAEHGDAASFPPSSALPLLPSSPPPKASEKPLIHSYLFWGSGDLWMSLVTLTGIMPFLRNPGQIT